MNIIQELANLADLKIAGYWSRRINDEHRIVLTHVGGSDLFPNRDIIMNIGFRNIPTQWKPYNQWKKA